MNNVFIQVYQRKEFLLPFTEILWVIMELLGGYTIPLHQGGF